jgi:hypothetical protein
MFRSVLFGTVAALALGACASAPPVVPYQTPYNRLQAKLARHVTSGDCPKVGEPALARSGQIAAATRNGYASSSGIMKDRSGREVWFIHTKETVRDTGSWIGQNAFGATARVTNRQINRNGIAVALDETIPADASVDYILDHSNDSIVRQVAFKTNSVSARIPSGAALWVSGPVIDGAWDDSFVAEATLTDPIEAKNKYHADHTIKLECAAYVDKNGNVVERLY